MTWLFLIKDGSEILSIFQRFHKEICLQFNCSLKILRSHNVLKYVQHALQDYYVSHSIIHQILCVHTPHQNGVVERKNRHLLDITRTLIVHMHVFEFFGLKQSLLLVT